MEYRKDETPQTWFRSERIFTSNGHWYFHTREGVAVGLYASRFEAEIDVSMLLSRLEHTPPEQVLAVIREFVLQADRSSCNLNTASFTDYLVDEGTVALR